MRADDERVPAGWLPQWTTSCFGRAELFDRARRQLSSARVLTLTGCAGVGKTTLALEVARSLRSDLGGGAWWVPLGDTTEPDLVAHKVAAALGVRHQSPLVAENAVVSYLQAHKDLLLVLDNCERVAGSVAKLVTLLIEHAPGIRILTTSRVPLRVGSEHLLVVPPLAVPPTEHVELTLSELARFPAVRVLCGRAAAVAPAFVLDDTTRVAIGDLIRELDGLPLAIEVAAGRLRALAPSEIVERSRELLATSTTSNVIPTQFRSVADSLRWSYQLCTEDQQVLWACASVFAVDGFDLAAAEAVCAGGGIVADQVADLVAALVDASVLVREYDDDGRSRYRLLGPFQQFGAEMLREMDDADQVRNRHLRYYSDMVAQAARDWFSPREVAIMTRLGAEAQNLRTAMQCAENDDAVDGLQIALRWAQVRMPQLWGPLSEIHHWLDRLLRDCSDAPAELRGAAVDMAAMTLVCMGASERADHLLATATGREHDPVHKHVRGASALLSHGDRRAIGLLSAAHKEFTVRNERGAAHMSLLLLSVAVSLMGRDVDARLLARRCLADAEEAGALWATSWANWAVGLAELVHGSARRALDAFRVALGVQHGLTRDRWGAPWSTHGVAWARAHSLSGDPRDATETAVLIGICDRLRSRTGVEISGMPLLAKIHERSVDRTRKALGDVDFEHALRVGRRLDIDGELRNELAWQIALGETPIPISRLNDGTPHLTSRQWTLVHLVGKRHTSRQIAARLNLSVRTVENMVQLIYKRLNWNRPNTRANLAAWADEHADMVTWKVSSG